MALKFACAFGLAIVLAACAGADSTELFEPPVTDTGSTLPPPAPTQSPTTPTPGTDNTPKPPTPPKPDDTKPACAAEVEPNNNRGNPTPFTSCVSGKLPNGNDVDNLTVKAPATAKTMTIKSSGDGGRVQFQVSGGNFLQGVNESWTDDESLEIPVVPDEAYTFQVRTGSTSGGERSWKVEVTFE